MLFSLRGVHVPHRKNTADMAAVRMPAPASVTIPMSMHIGKPAKPIVKVGDLVSVGTLIAEQDGFISSPIYSSVSGKVTKIGEVLTAGGAKCTAVTIESDGEMRYDESIAPPTVNSKEDLIAAIRAGGMVGLGGAGFPTYVKFNIPDGKVVDELIINSAECEPYITSDTRTMLDKADDMATGIEYILKYIDIKRVIIGIESNKGPAIDKMRELASRFSNVSVHVLSTLYPQGGEKVLIYHTTGKVVPAGKLPLDVGCIVCNCTSMAAIGNYIKTGIPLVSKCITVDGSAIANRMNVIAPIGTAVKDVIEFTGGFSEEAGKILLGGPMMGFSIPSVDLPVMKNTNAIIAFNQKDAKLKRETACIRCGACASHCPFSLNPAAFMRANKKGDVDELIKLRVDICMECGCCSFICPAGQPLVENNKLSKAAVRAAMAKKKEGGAK